MTLALKATIVMLGAIVILYLARRASASFRHLVIVSAFGALLILPIASVSMPVRVITLRQQSARPVVHESRAERTAPAAHKPSINFIDLATGIYVAGVVLFIAPLLSGIWCVHRLRRHAEFSIPRTQLTNGIEVSVSRELAVPMTFGFRHPVILLPSETNHWTDQEVLRCIRHELAHVARGDWPAQIVSRLVCALYWPHPFVWILWRKLRLEAERACDDAVIRSRADTVAYAEQLVSLARTVADRRLPALAMASRTHLGLRVESILDERRRRAPLSRMSTISIAAVAMVLMLAVAPFELISAPAHAGSLDMPLLEAAQRGDLQPMRDLLHRGANPDAVIPGDGSPLIAAARRGQIDAMNLLIEKGAEVDLGVPGDGNPLIMAAGAGEVEAMRVLLDRGASIDAVVPGDENPLITASANGHADAVRLLIERGANVDARVWAESFDSDRSRGEWRTPLGMARRNGHADIERLLLSAGARQ
ncbi:MAG TPA: M56 family metallopeptidase [Thermoanaerobaculia bacterium]|nr:M56 family metallopeptidase [Thermoanaerobaculia bacterium]